ncbi:MAG: S41 family peptidase [Chlorobi bacterium]|nr:S41 family peptidase [Chlorobiota bacterium]
MNQKGVLPKRRFPWIFPGLFVVVFSLGFLAVHESHNFKIAKNLEIFTNTIRELNLYYVDTIQPDKLVKSGIDAMLNTLDPYTVYIPESEMANFRFMTTGQYGGIGSLIRKEGDYAVISELYKNFPADKAGLKVGDKIIKIDDISIKGLPLDKVSERLKGIPNTNVILTISRYGIDKPLVKEITRNKISISSVPYYGMIDDETGYIRLVNFTSSAYKEVREALTDLLKKDHPQSVILDLRGNPGGLLLQAVDIVSLFVEKGQEVVSTRGKIADFDHTYVTKLNPVDTQIRLAVLVNRGSASASEIVSGALQDLDRAVIVGERTFGKGLVQTTRPIGYNNQLKITTAKYYIPSGRCIQALDYSHRNPDGSVGHIPDSLISSYKTLHGRTVYDGGGIVPDVKVKENDFSPLTINLYVGFQIFNFATRFASQHDSIPGPDRFSVTNDMLQQFLEYLHSIDFSYSTGSEESLNKLIATAKKEKYYDRAASEFTQLKTKLSHDLGTDFEMHRDEISQLLKSEILGRYYYQSGRIQGSLPKDKIVGKAAGVLENKDTYKGILEGNMNTEEKISAAIH